MSKESHDQKRKKKLEERKQKARQVESLVYMGEKYKTDELIPSWMHTEIGIYRTYIITDRKIFDQTVISALERLIQQMRSGSFPPLPETNQVHYEVGREDDLLIENIRLSWSEHFATEWQPPKDVLIGVLRSILGSIQKVKAPGPQSQAYLRHIAGFLTKRLGVSIKAVAEDLTPLPEPEEDELVLLGREWSADGNQEARAEFFELASHLMRNGQTSRVIDACHLLTGELCDPSSEIVAELVDLVHQARESLITEMS